MAPAEFAAAYRGGGRFARRLARGRQPEFGRGILNNNRRVVPQGGDDPPRRRPQTSPSLRGLTRAGGPASGRSCARVRNVDTNPIGVSPRPWESAPQGLFASVRLPRGAHSKEVVMLVIISDLHLTDGSSGATISCGAFEIFVERLRDLALAASKRVDGRYQPVE